MSTSVAHHCPDCQAEISPDLHSCLQCGADVGNWPEAQRTPLILPGNPALSVDVVRKRTSVPKIVLGSVLTASVVGAVLYYMPEREAEEVLPVAAVAPSRDSVRPTVELASAPVTPSPAPSAAEPVTADSLAAFSYGDTALTRTVPQGAPAAMPRPVVPAPPVATTPERRSVTATLPAGPAPRPDAPVKAPTPAAAKPAVAKPVAAEPTARPAASPALALAPVVSSTLRPGERLQLRWSVTDRRTRQPVAGTRVEFTSTDATVATVNPTTGLVVARAPGTTRIIIDGRSAGQQTLALSVRAPAPSPIVTVAPTAPTDIARNPVATTPPPAPVTPAPVLTPVRESGTALPDAGEVRAVVDRFIRDVRRDAVRNFEVTQFLADGADHRVTLMRGPSIVSNTGMGVRVAFDMRFTKFDGGGRPVTRVSSVTMDVDKRDGQPSSSAVAIGALRRP